MWRYQVARHKKQGRCWFVCRPADVHSSPITFTQRRVRDSLLGWALVELIKQHVYSGLYKLEGWSDLSILQRNTPSPLWYHYRVNLSLVLADENHIWWWNRGPLSLGKTDKQWWKTGNASAGTCFLIPRLANWLCPSISGDKIAQRPGKRINNTLHAYRKAWPLILASTHGI